MSYIIINTKRYHYLVNYFKTENELPESITSENIIIMVHHQNLK